MKKTLYLNLIIAYLIFGCFGFIIVSTLISKMSTNEVYKTKAQEMYYAASEIAATHAQALYNNETSLTTLKDELDSLGRMLGARIWIINPSGLVILDSDMDINVDSPPTIEGFDPTIFTGTYYSISNFYGQFESEQLSVAATVAQGYSVVGYVIIHVPVASLQPAINHFVNIDYLVLGIIFLLSLIILIFFTELVYIPLRKITVATEQYAAGNLHYELQVDSNDELGYLAASLAYMATELSKGEDNIKQLVANVSHDFRSPLTSIKGYLEAIEDGTIGPEDYDRYIGIVLNETDRLIKLTNSLLTLNNLNTEGMVLEKTDFNLNKVIRHTAQTFEGKCKEKKIVFKLTLTSDIMMVYADKTRIQQVLYNLLDNAIKFSSNNSFIAIETREKHGKLFVSVKDSGIGIPKDSIGLVFDRFYKTDISRGKDKKGTGLGLSITREIIRAHGENINVISTEGVGSEFIFSLPISKTMEEVDSI